MSSSAKINRYAHAPWCSVDDIPLSADATQYTTTWFRHQCGCPFARVYLSAVKTTKKLCGFPAFTVIDGSPRKFYALKDNTQTIGAYKEACYGYTDGIHYRETSEYIKLTRETAAWTNQKTPEGYDNFVCTYDSEIISDEGGITNYDDCDMPDPYMTTGQYIRDYLGDCTPLYSEYNPIIIFAGVGDASLSQSSISHDLSETEYVISHYRTTITNTAKYTEITCNKVENIETNCGYTEKIESNEEVKTILGETSVYDDISKQTLSEEVTSPQTIAIVFSEQSTASDYAPIRDDDGSQESQIVYYCILCDTLLPNVEYRVRVKIIARERWLDDNGAIQHGDWADYYVDEYTFRASERTHVLGGEWLDDETKPTEDAAKIEHVIPDDAPNFRTVANARAHNDTATLRPLERLGDDTPGLEYAIKDIAITPTIGTHTHDHESE